MSLRPRGTTGRSPMSSRNSEASIEPTGTARSMRAISSPSRCGQPDPAGAHAEQDEAVQAPVALEDLVRHAGRRPPDVVRGQDPLGVRRRAGGAARHALFHGFSCRASLTGPASRSTARVAATAPPRCGASGRGQSPQRGAEAERRRRQVLERGRRPDRDAASPHVRTAARTSPSTTRATESAPTTIENGTGVRPDGSHVAALELDAVRRRPRLAARVDRYWRSPVVAWPLASSTTKRRLGTRASRRARRRGAGTCRRAALVLGRPRVDAAAPSPATHPVRAAVSGSHVTPSAAGSSSVGGRVAAQVHALGRARVHGREVGGDDLADERVRRAPGARPPRRTPAGRSARGRRRTTRRCAAARTGGRRRRGRSGRAGSSPRRTASPRCGPTGGTSTAARSTPAAGRPRR